MKVKKVNRYYCEFCKKSGCSGGHIRKHEERCTMNPNRICGMCKLLDNTQPDLQKLIAILPKTKLEECEGGEMYRSVDLTDEFREASGGCPACTMAAIRQSNLPVPAYRNFNFTEECKCIWAAFNAAKSKEDYY